MNTQSYRLIFNKSRGCLMVVGENARSAGGASCSATRRRRRACSASLTGNRFLGDYRSDEAQYMALMTAGATFARAQQLRPGIALSGAQVAQLTSDIVWLVTQQVRLPDGSTTTALVPRVYLAPKAGDLAQSGQLFASQASASLISARDIQLAMSGDVSNSATIAGRQLVNLSAQNINNTGLIQANVALLKANENINILGGQVTAQAGMAINAGGDLNLSTTTQSSANKAGNGGQVNSFAQTGIDRVAGLYVSGPAGVLLASAGRDLNLTAAQVINQGSGAMQLSAGNTLNLNTVQTGQSQDITWSAANTLRQSSSQEVGSQVSAGGNLNLQAGQDLNARAAQINASGALSVGAGGNVVIEAGQSSQSLAEASQSKSSGFLSSKTTITRTSSASTTAQASELGGQSVTIASGADTRITGSNVLADQDVALSAGRDLTIEAAQNTQTTSNFTQTTQSGLMSGGGLSISIGTQSQSLDQQNAQTTAAASTVGSTGGSVRISAGNTYTQTGSDVLTPAGSIAISAKSVNIQEARETASNQVQAACRPWLAQTPPSGQMRECML